jgi:hypothetical protein
MVSLSLIGGNGDVISLDSTDYQATVGLTGTGIPASQLQLTESAGDGGTWRGTRKAMRDIDLPIVVLGSSRTDVEEKLRRLANALSDRVGVPKLVVEYADSSAYEIDVHYVAGAETVHGGESGDYYCQWAITLRAPNPYWHSINAYEFAVSASSTAATFLPNLRNLNVSPSDTLGSVTVENTGDVPAYPVWTLTGPLESVSIGLDGVGFTYTETLSAGVSIIIDTQAATVKNSAGVNKYGNLSAAPKLFRIPPGTSTLQITATGTSAGARISGYFQPLREVIY